MMHSQIYTHTNTHTHTGAEPLEALMNLDVMGTEAELKERGVGRDRWINEEESQETEKLSICC